MSSAPITQIPRNLLMRYRFPCRHFDGSDLKSVPGEEYRLPAIGRFEGQRVFADWRVGWNAGGLRISLRVTGRTASLWCKPAQILESDGLHVWIDTRESHDVHRATRYCHWLMAMPCGGSSGDGSHCSMLKINRAKEDSPAINRARALCGAKVRRDGYDLDLFLPAAMLNGWNPDEQPTIGFFLAVSDRELGWQTLGVGPELPLFEDPSLWQTLRLVKPAAEDRQV